MKRLLNVALVAMLALAAACGDKEAEVDPDQPPPPPEPTTQEIVGKFDTALTPAKTEFQTTGALSVATKEQALAALRTEQSNYRGKVHLGEAQAQVASDVSGMLDTALTAAEADQSQNAGLWTGVLGLADVLATLDPASPKVARAKQKAEREINRPRVVGSPNFFEHEGTVVVFVDVLFPETGKTESYKPHEGEEFAEGKMRLKEIIGRNQGVKISYTDDGKVIELRRR